MPMPRFWIMAVGMVYYILRDSPRALLLLAVLAVSVRYSIVPSWSVFGITGVWTYGYLQIICYMLLTTMPTKTMSWLKWAGIALAIHAVAQRLGLDPVIFLKYGRATAWVGTPVNLAALLALAAPAAGFAWLPVMLAGMWAAGSRGAVIATIFAMSSNRVRWCLLPVLIAVPLISNAPKEVARQEMLKIAWRGFMERPWFGNGPNTYDEIFARKRTERLVKATYPSYRQNHAHNDIFEALCSTGILGLLAYLFFIWPLRGNACLVSLFVFMKFNPVGYEALCAAALVAAYELRQRKGPAGLQTLGAASLVFPSAVPTGAGLGSLRKLYQSVRRRPIVAV